MNASALQAHAGDERGDDDLAGDVPEAADRDDRDREHRRARRSCAAVSAIGSKRCESTPPRKIQSANMNAQPSVSASPALDVERTRP